VLAALVVVMVCGEGLCETCPHACLSRLDRADRFRRTVARILSQFAAVMSAGRSAVVAAFVPADAPRPHWRPLPLEFLAPLRI
jgi:hypothetical protein